MFDIKALEGEIDKEMADEAMAQAKEKLVVKRREIKRAETIVRNLRREYDALLLEVTEDVA